MKPREMDNTSGIENHAKRNRARKPISAGTLPNIKSGREMKCAKTLASCCNIPTLPTLVSCGCYKFRSFLDYPEKPPVSP